MPNVYKFPPVGISAYENTIDDPMSISVGNGGAARGSQTRANRTLYAARVHGPLDGVGYVEALKHLLKGQLPLVQVDTCPAIWWNRIRGRGDIERTPLIWTSGGEQIAWTNNGNPVTWYETNEIQATAGNDGFDYIDITKVGAGYTFHVGEAIQGGGKVAYVLREVITGGDSTRIYLTGPIPSGDVIVGQKVTRVFRLLERPRAMQTTGNFSYDFNMIEAFKSDYADGFTVLDPWS